MDSNVQSSLPITEQHLNSYRCVQQQDPVCQQVTEYCKNGLPRKGLVTPEFAPYWKVRASLTVCKQLLMYDKRMAVPKEQKIHAGYQGIERCRARVTLSVWWPGVSQQNAQTVRTAVW